MYGKFFASAFTGSMMASGSDVFAVWGYVVANAVDSRVELNPRLLAAIIGADVKSITAAIEKLCAPDPESRSKELEGRRLIKEGEFQYFVTGHAKYRAIRHEADRREYNRVKKQESRARLSVKAMSNGLSSVSANTEAEAEAEAHIQASPVVKGKPSTQAECPHAEILKLWARHMPAARQPAEWTPARQTLLRSRWRESPKRQTLQWWDRFFAYVATSEFLTGKVHTPGRKPFEISLDWLLKSEHFLKTIEGGYHNEAEA